MPGIAKAYVIVLRSSSSITIFLRGCISFFPITSLNAAGRKKDRGYLVRDGYSRMESQGVH